MGISPGSVTAPPPPPAPVAGNGAVVPPPLPPPLAPAAGFGEAAPAMPGFSTPRGLDPNSPASVARPAGLPPAPPMAGPRTDGDNQFALVPAPPLSPAMPMPEEAGYGELALSQTQNQLLRRVRRMYIEKVIRNSEKLAYDERVDMRSSVPHPMAQVANALAYTAVVSYWITALILTAVYAVHLSSRDSLRWLYSCLSSWIFTWFILEVVKALLVTILELQQLSQRRRLRDHRSLRDQVAMKKAAKMKQMTAIAQSTGIAIPQLAVLPAPPMPPPAMGDASAG